MLAGRLGLKGSLILYGVLGILVLLAVLYRITATAIGDSTATLLRERSVLARSIAEEIEVPLQHALYTMQQVAATSDMATFENPETFKETLSSLYSHFVDFHHFNVTAMAALGPRGEILSTIGEWRNAEGSPDWQAPALRHILETRTSVLRGGIEPSVASQPNVLLEVPVFDPNGQFHGVLIAAMDPIHPAVALGTVAQVAPEHYHIEIANEAGLVMAASKSEVVGQASEHAQAILPLMNKEETGAVVHLESEGMKAAGKQDHVVAFARLPTLGWVLMIEQENDIVLSLPEHLKRDLVSLGALASLTIVALGWIIAQRILVPIERLTAASQRIASGDLDTAVPVERKDEVGKLAYSFEEMRIHLKASQAEIQRWNQELEARVQQRTKELAALFEAARAITSVLDQNGLVEIFMEKVRAVVPQSEAAVLYLWDSGTDSLVARGWVGIDPVELAPVLPPWEQTLAGRVFQSPRVLSLNKGEDMQARDEVFPTEAVPGRGAHNGAAGLPLATQERRLGCLLIYTSDLNLCPTEHDLQVLQTLVDQMAVALENARLFEEAKLVGALRRLDALKSEFVAWASHVLRTPLASIKSLAETLLRDDLSLSSRDQKEFLSLINNSCDRLARVLDNLLTLSKIEAGQIDMRFSNVSLRPLVHKVVDQFRFQYPNRRFSVALSTGLPPVHIDPDRFEDVLSNLLSNAVKYSPGHETISVSLQPVAPSKNGDSSKEQAGSVTVSVADRGMGIPLEAQSQLFQRFYRVDSPLERQTAGSGLGLYISKTYVDAMGGDIQVESTMGKGSTFSFTVPAAKSTVGSETQTLASTGGRGGSRDGKGSVQAHALMGKHVLLVDDAPEVLRAMEVDLQASGIETRTSHTGEECLNILQNDRPDAIVLDIVLPGMSGLDVLRRLHADPLTREIPVIMVSARAQEQDVLAAEAEGARAYLKKPFSMPHLRGVLVDILKDYLRQP